MISRRYSKTKKILCRVKLTIRIGEKASCGNHFKNKNKAEVFIFKKIPVGICYQANLHFRDKAKSKSKNKKKIITQYPYTNKPFYIYKPFPDR